MTENEISYKIIGAIYKVYNELGPGLLESVYEAALCYQLRKDGLRVENQVKLDVMYDGKVLPVDFRLDILVEDKVIVELKSVTEMKDVFHKQLLTYLRVAKKHLGILVNFSTTDIRKSIFRKVNGYTPIDSPSLVPQIVFLSPTDFTDFYRFSFFIIKICVNL